MFTIIFDPAGNPVGRGQYSDAEVMPVFLSPDERPCTQEQYEHWNECALSGRTVVRADDRTIEARRLADAASAARTRRNELLATCDDIVTRHRDQLDEGTEMDLSEEAYRAWLAYRRALRDLTGQPGFPMTIDWPVAPNSATSSER